MGEEKLLVVRGDPDKLPAGFTIITEKDPKLRVKTLAISRTLYTKTSQAAHNFFLEFLQGGQTKSLNMTHRLSPETKKALEETMDFLEAELNIRREWEQAAQ